jgi:subtilisin family serine protease
MMPDSAARCRRYASLLASAVWGLSAGHFAAAQVKLPVRSADDLPRHTYQVPGTASELLVSDEQFAALARQVRANIEADFIKYQIDDRSTLRRLAVTLLNLDVLEGRWDAALRGVERVRNLEHKQSKKLTSGVVIESYAAARRQCGPDDAAFRAAFKQGLLERLRSLPWDLVGDEIEQRMAQAEVLTEEYLSGSAQSGLDPAVARNAGEISGELARRLIGLRFARQIMVPLRDELVAAYQAVIDEQQVAQKDIWTERTANLAHLDSATPVLVGVWDSGVDPASFTSQLFVNPRETPDGQDNDGNGFVDDLHGVAFDLDGEANAALLAPLSELKSEPADMTRQLKGFLDLRAAVNSPEAREVKRMMRGLRAAQVKALVEDFALFNNYVHGTHVAGIAIDGNPFARVLIARLTFDHHVIPLCPTQAWVQRTAVAYQRTVDYFKANGVRVVNMSWGEARRTIEAALEKNGAGGHAEERAALARELFKILRTGLFDALQGAPDILFVAAAGNADSDVEFDEMIPSGFTLPNLLVVGAVNRAGEPTGFTSFGRTVRVYANGFEVESVIPGGQKLKLSGTSMAAPNVANLAAKLLALRPDLKPAQVIELIETNADPADGQKPLLLINPKKTLAASK